MSVSLDFHPVSFSDSEVVKRYMSAGGEGSCQHSFVSMISYSEKYGDSVFEDNGILYTLRSRLCNDDFRVYLAPMCIGLDEETEKEMFALAVSAILEDAHKRGCKVFFHTLTERTSALLNAKFPDRFTFTERRDMAEYICLTRRMATLSGQDLKTKRKEVNRIHRTYGGRLSSSVICPDDFDEILAFEDDWLRANSSDPGFATLKLEERMIRFQLEHFEELSIAGVVIRVDGNVVAFSYGSRLNDDYFDGIAQKGSKSVPNISRLVFQEAVLKAMTGFKYVNMEEDVGDPGLRNMKMLYHPDILLKKFDVREI